MNAIFESMAASNDTETLYVRLPPDLKKAVEQAAKREEVSVNEFAIGVLAEAAGAAGAVPRGAKNDLQVDATMRLLTARAVAGESATYGEVAQASGVEWRRARLIIHRHLETVAALCQNKRLPNLTAIVGDRQGKVGGGFYEVARGLGAIVPVDEPGKATFLRASQDAVWAWGRDYVLRERDEDNPFAALAGVWQGPAVDDLLDATRGPPDETVQ